MLAMTQDHELDRGATSVAPGTQRTCALTRSQQPVENLLRFVVGPAGEAVPDVKRKLPGRGIWITATRAALDEAVKRRVFARGFKREVRVAADLAAQTEHLMERAALDALSIAGKAGAVLTGTEPGRGGDRTGRYRRADPCGRCRRRRQTQAECGIAPRNGRKIA